ncbi:dihydrofolate reductase family protein [Xanthobacter dioxanivorans]|uniref:Dihydrofolate reductase family protein n=1 Tax=Xanthobacter dioxanivorans TaxID=2528964 RepID=A0A974PRD8_9HYPH|nr:RibD family protein [Xanthobacter dioxanivorans]QRG08280.1 dihydrofolate reductase family protein [Xanthobacter dioxanivorans]
MDDTTGRPKRASRRPAAAACVQVAIPAAAHKAPDGPRERDRPFVIAQLGQSLDGRIATTSGESKYINGAHALDHLHALRASVDAVVVGVGTIAADNPLLTVRRIPGRSPARVVVDPSGRADPAALCFRADGARRMVVRRAGLDRPMAEGVEEIVLAGAAAFAPAAILAALAERGMGRILLEGGPSTLRAFLAAGAIHALHVFVSPVILGAGRLGLERDACDSLADALRPPARVQVFPDGDVLFECDLSRAADCGGTHEDRRETVSHEPDEQAPRGRDPEALRAAG